ncbi:MAG: DUF3794 domain-containing protein [Oscillospiraceae bacterium]|nr:DUF3794 domain-containing protein [Oscillospiraceae bacterium]
MEQRFERRTVACLQRYLWQPQEREQTQELRLGDDMPDIGGVIAVRGHCILRSKEWQGDSIGFSGGIMAWVLYAPADGGQARMVEAWIPVQMKWNVPQTRREGSIRVSMTLQSIDARSISARKMVVRANVSALAEALGPWETEVFVPAQQDSEQIQMLRCQYPVVLPMEAGEKLFQVEEEIAMPAGAPQPQKILSFELVPKVTERDVVGGKAVFRGEVGLRLCYETSDREVCGVDLEASFSQFTDLDREHGKDATVSVVMAVTSGEPELQDGRVLLKCGLVAQYLVYDETIVELVEDAYSTENELDVVTQRLVMPAMAERCTEDIRCVVEMDVEASGVVDAWVCPGQPRVRRAGDLTELTMDGSVWVLYLDREGALQGVCCPWERRVEHPAVDQSSCYGRWAQLGRPMVTVNAGKLEAKLDMTLLTHTVDESERVMVSSVEVGGPLDTGKDRPSLILRRMESSRLWDLAKECGSTVDAIRKANGMSDEEMVGSLILIPIP